MIAVIFEVTPAPGSRSAYLGAAAALLPQLQGMDGFISIERFESMSRPDTLLSLSFWRDEAAVAAWRRVEPHRLAQRLGREHLFADYRLRVAGVLRDYGLHDRSGAPPDSQEVHR